MAERGIQIEAKDLARAFPDEEVEAPQHRRAAEA